MRSSAPLSVVIPTLDAARDLPASLAAIDAARGSGLLREIVVADGGSADATAAIAQAAGARVVPAPRGRGSQLGAGAAAAEGEWLCFLHADTRPGPRWCEVVARFIADRANGERAGYFRFRLDDEAAAARRLERMVAWRSRVLGLPYGDQGLVIAKRFYTGLGGFPARRSVGRQWEIVRVRFDGISPRPGNIGDRIDAWFPNIRDGGSEPQGCWEN